MLRVSTCVLIAFACVLAMPGAAAAKDCTAVKPFKRAGEFWVVYTFSEPGRATVGCAKARRMTASAMRGRKISGWKCNRRMQRCVRGGTYTDEYGYTQWRYIVGWHIAD